MDLRSLDLSGNWCLPAQSNTRKQEHMFEFLLIFSLQYGIILISIKNVYGVENIGNTYFFD